MNQMTDVSHKKPKTSGYEDHSLLDLVWEMKLLDMDPSPLLEIAVNDIVAKHGDKAVGYIERQQKQMHEDNNPSGIYLWDTLSKIITMRFLAGPTAIH